MKQGLKKERIIEDKSQLTEFFKSGCRPQEEFKIGLEFEKLAVNSYNYKAVPYSGQNGIRDFLGRYKSLTQTENILDDDNLIGLAGFSGNISLEPGSQMEISTIPCKKISELASIIQEYNFKTAIIGEELGIDWIGYGVQPVSTFESIELIPKKRYEIMTEYLPTRGNKALVMMRETAGIQVNIDYESEHDAMEKFRAFLAISPVITAMFANSPIRGGKETGYKSYRALSWLDTDNDRCGFINNKIFKGEFSFDDYAEYLLDVPMFFIERYSRIIKATHLTFRKFLDEGLDGYRANLNDWAIHISTVFPEVRLKNHIEIRNCDSQKCDLILAMPTLIKGIMHNKESLEQVLELMKDFSLPELEEMRQKVPKSALETVIKGVKVADLAKELVNIAEYALLSDPKIADEAIYLEKLKELVEQEINPADIILQNWNSGWDKDVKKLIEYSKLN